MLDNNYRVAKVCQPAQHVEKLFHIFEVETRGGLVENVKCLACRPLAQFFREFDSLCFSTGKTGGGPIQGQVFQADIDQELETSTNLFEHLPGYKAFSLS